MNVLMCKPGVMPYEKEIPNNLHELQKAVGGYIEAIYPFEDEVALICNEEGKLNGLAPNRLLKDYKGKIYDVICGPCFICGLSEDDFDSIPKELVSKYEMIFRENMI